MHHSLETSTNDYSNEFQYKNKEDLSDKESLYEADLESLHSANRQTFITEPKISFRKQSSGTLDCCYYSINASQTFPCRGKIQQE